MEKEYTKDFDGWAKQKKRLNNILNWPVDAFPGEIWWCALGVNIGTETDGKNQKFERPIIILKHVNREMVLIAPLTSTTPQGVFSPEIKTSQTTSTVKLNQMRIVNKRRLLRKIRVVPSAQFGEIKRILLLFLS